MSEKPVALVTGGSRGIGKGIAGELARIGYDLLICHFDFDTAGRADDQTAEQTRRELEQMKCRCAVGRFDISSHEERLKLVGMMRSSYGRCDLLVNNTGVAPSRRTDLLEATEESYDRVMGINLKGPYFLTQQVARWMIEQKKQFPDLTFRIVNISSISAYTSSPSRGEYCLSKAGVSMMTRLYADRLAEYGIGVFEIQPGIIATDMTQAVKEKYDKMIAEGLTPIQRWGQPGDVGRAVAAVAQGQLDFSTGQVINVDGGFHLRRL
jgi:3-oxoacyl-[acyl-carrier protein] reductase